MGVNPKNRGVYPPKWMVYFMENPIKMDDLGGFPIFSSFGNNQIILHEPSNAQRNVSPESSRKAKKNRPRGNS